MSAETPPGGDQRATLERAYLELGRRRAELDELRRARSEPVAVLGFGCRFPGEADDGDAFWRLLEAGRDALGDVPRTRWDPDALEQGHLDARARASLRHGAFLRDVEHFDAPFFGLSPREARAIDPQQRLLLELAWEALEHANLPPSSLRGTATGVFVGLTCFDHALRLSGSRAGRGPYAGVGGALNVAAGRVAYVLGLNGPCAAVDTACSSALLALHLACASLRQRECDTALVGGALLMLSGEVMTTFAQAQMLSPEGRCKTFDQAADGYARGEGGAVLVLRRLSDAQARGDRILALVRGSAVNHAGASGGLTVPSARSQEQVIRAALRAAQVAPAEVSYVEAHGTGTPLGDPIEMDAVAAAYGAGRRPDRPLLVGSVKTNIGHLEPASGLAGLIKLCLAFEHETIPPHLHFTTPNAHIPWDGLPVRVPSRSEPWPRGAELRLAGLSAFGFSGTNVHVIVQEPPLPAPDPEPRRAVQVLPLSARTAPALETLAGRYRDFLEARPEAPLLPIAASAARGRDALEERLAVVADGSAAAAAALRAWAAGETPPQVVRGRRRAGDRPRVAFLFTGQGAQHAGMGRELYAAEPAFRAALDRCAEVLAGRLERPLLELLFASADAPEALDQTSAAQPALVALEYALGELWRSWGLEPDLVLGHSVGEYAAALAAGMMPLDQGLGLLCTRARLMQDLPRAGGLLAVRAAEDEVARRVESAGAGLAIAALNGPRHVVVAGADAALDALARALRADGLAATRLRVSHAFHSAAMEPLLPELESAAAAVDWREPRLRFVSSVTGREARGEAARAAYWARQAREPVRFGAALATLVGLGTELVVEVGPQPVLIELLRESAGDAAPVAFPSLRRGRPEHETLLRAAAGCWAHGVELDWGACLPDASRRVVLPGYPFERRRCALDEDDEGGGEPARVPRGALPQRDADRADVERRLRASGRLSPAELALVPRLLDELSRLDEAPESGGGDACAYRLAWEERAPDAARPAADEGGWLVLHDGDDCGLGAQLGARLRDEGRAARVVRVVHDRPAAPAELDLRGPEPLLGLLADARAAGAPVRHVVFLCGGRALEPEAGAAEVEQALRPATRGALHVIQALARARADAARLWLVTRDAVPAGASPALAGLAQAPLWGLGQAALLEYPDVVAGLVDLDARPDAREAETLLSGLRASDREPCAAWRGGRRHVPRVVRAELPPAAELSLDGAASYLVTGGLGTLGLRVARWLVGQGARRLLLVGRGAPGPEVRRALAELTAAGAQVDVAQADVADEAALARALAPVRASLRGVVHAAGAPGYAPLAQLDAATLDAVTRAKTLGAWNLHRLTAPLDLDFFIAFASIASVWGARLQAHYAAGSAFLDALAHHRRARGLPALSVDWGPWAEGGMTTPEAATLLRRIGVETLAPADALRALSRLHASGLAQAALARVDWRRFTESYEAVGQRSLLERLATRDDPPAAGPAPLVARLAGLDPAGRAEQVEVFLRAELGRVLELPDPAAVERDQGFFALGMDSLTALEFRRRLEAALGRALPAGLVFEQPDLAALTRFVLRQVQPGDEGVAGAGADEAARGELISALDDLERLSEDEAAEALRRTLAGIGRETP